MEIRAERAVAAPIETVFGVFSDVTKIAERIGGITTVEILSGDTTVGVGTRWRETRVMFGREATEEMEISAFDRPNSYDVTAASHGTEYHTRYDFTSRGDGTEVTMVFTGKPVSVGAKLMSPVGFLFKGATEKAFAADMDDLKAVCEQARP